MAAEHAARMLFVPFVDLRVFVFPYVTGVTEITDPTAGS